MQKANQILNPVDISHIQACQYGIKMEAVAVKAFEEQTGLKTERYGLFIYQKYPFLGSTPDRLVVKDGILHTLEIKCPFSCKEKEINVSNVPYLYLENGKICLEKKAYFAQIQGQLMCTGLDKAILVVFSNKNIVILDIYRDDRYIQEMEDCLVSFYNDFFKKALLEKYFYRV